MLDNRKRTGLLNAIAKISHAAMTVFSCGISTISIVAAALISRISAAVKQDPLGAVDYYGPMIEYIMMSLLIVIAGAAAFDIMDKNRRG